MTRSEKRGSKRRCVNEQCALPFYDLNRSEFACPNCGTAFVIHVAPPVAARTNWRTGRPISRVLRTELPVEHVAEAIDEIAVGGADDADIAATDGAEVLLEAEEDEVPIEPTPGTAAHE